MESAVSRFYPLPDPYWLPGPKAIAVGIDASTRVGLGFFLSILEKTNHNYDTYSSGCLSLSPPIRQSKCNGDTFVW